MTRRSFLSTLSASVVANAAAAEHKTQNVVLVTADGLRWQEIFRGIDPKLMNREDAGMKDAEELRSSLWAESVEERRQKLFPFLWGKLVPKGALFGNRDHGGDVSVRNRHRFSYPGYSEILVGRPQDDVIDSNAMRPNPSKTVLEIAREELKLSAKQVALFGSWNVFQGIGAQQPGSVFINAGYQPIDAPEEELRRLSDLQFDLLTPWPTVRHDYFTCEAALAYLRARKPRVLYVALGETDDWAHGNRYDRTLETAQYFDRCLAKLWTAIEGDPFYAGRTTLLATTDHGRGRTPEDWQGHGTEVDGAEEIWIAALGPDTPALGDAANTAALTQSDIAPTMLELLGVDPAKLGAVGRPIDAVLGR